MHYREGAKVSIFCVVGSYLLPYLVCELYYRQINFNNLNKIKFRFDL